MDDVDQSCQNEQQGKEPNDVQIDNSQSVLVKIATLYAERLMNDICLVVAGVEYPSHRLILCASSEVFQVMLMNPQWSESHESRVVLQETPACAAIFGEFIKYFYTGKIKINQDIVTPLLALADKYNVKDLIQLCIDYMCDHIALAASNNQLVTWFQYTVSLGHKTAALNYLPPKLRKSIFHDNTFCSLKWEFQACQDFLKWNFETVASGKDFANCNQEMLSRLLQWNDLVVTNEITLFRFIETWIEYQKQNMIEEGLDAETVESYLESLVYEVMSHIRFPMMSPSQLADLLIHPLTQKYKEFFVERMGIGMAFHRNQLGNCGKLLSDDENRLMFTPRLYTSETFCSTMTIENFSDLHYYRNRKLVYSSPCSLADYEGDQNCDWSIKFSKIQVPGQRHVRRAPLVRPDVAHKLNIRTSFGFNMHRHEAVSHELSHGVETLLQHVVLTVIVQPVVVHLVTEPGNYGSNSRVNIFQNFPNEGQRNVSQEDLAKITVHWEWPLFEREARGGWRRVDTIALCHCEAALTTLRRRGRNVRGRRTEEATASGEDINPPGARLATIAARGNSDRPTLIIRPLIMECHSGRRSSTEGTPHPYLHRLILSDARFSCTISPFSAGHFVREYRLYEPALRLLKFMPRWKTTGDMPQCVFYMFKLTTTVPAEIAYLLTNTSADLIVCGRGLSKDSGCTGSGHLTGCHLPDSLTGLVTLDFVCAANNANHRPIGNTSRWSLCTTDSIFRYIPGCGCDFDLTGKVISNIELAMKKCQKIITLRAITDGSERRNRRREKIQAQLGNENVKTHLKLTYMTYVTGLKYTHVFARLTQHIKTENVEN
ncbi:unnamed protein product, partial [Nesidiocoris tenuis]